MTWYICIFINIFIFAECVTSSPLNASCTISNYDDVAAAAKSCSTLTLKNIVIPAKTTMNIALKDGATLIFDGHITHVPAEWPGVLIYITGNNVKISGTTSHLIDGLGAKHWKGKEVVSKPKLLRLKLTNSEVTLLKLKNCPVACVSVACSNTVISSIHIDNKDGYPGIAGNNYAINTDGFDVSSSVNLTIKNSVVINQDDCVAVNGGNNLKFSGLWCNGSHGFSLSVRSGDVHDVVFKNCHMEDATGAIHVKTHNDGDAGKIDNILYQNITFKAISWYGISVQQNYPSGVAKANVPITNLVLRDVTGTMTGSDHSVGINIICAQNGCSNWTWTGVKVTGAKQKDVCQNVPSHISC